MSHKLFIGTSGYSYPHWKKVFYPADLDESNWLEFYAKKFKAVELNVTFYRLPNKKTFEGWYKKTPKDFRFAIKGSRFITHVKRLKNDKDSIKIFFEQISSLGEKLSAVLWQLPPKFRVNIERLEDFLADTHNSQLVFGKTREVFEFRDASWFCDDVYEILRKYNAAIALADHPFEMNTVPPTADFIYIRRHGPASLFSSKYSLSELRKLAESVKTWQKQKKDAYVFFNNDARGYAVENALGLKKLLR